MKRLDPQALLADAIKLLERYPTLLESHSEAAHADRVILGLHELKRTLPASTRDVADPLPHHQVKTPLKLALQAEAQAATEAYLKNGGEVRRPRRPMTDAERAEAQWERDERSLEEKYGAEAATALAGLKLTI